MGPGHGGPGELLAAAEKVDNTRLLQWGRATEGPERNMPRWDWHAPCYASMGPGHGGPGERGKVHSHPR